MMTRKEFWKRLFYAHDQMKRYYIPMSFLLLLVFPFKFVFNLSMWTEIVTDPIVRKDMLMVFYLLMALFGLVCLIVYFTVWRFVFPRYYIVRGRQKYPAGRAYWYSSGGLASWSIRKREWCGAAFPLQPYVWVNQGLLNIFSPWGSMYRVWLPEKTKFIRDATELRVWEPPHKKLVLGNDGCVEYMLDGDPAVFSSEVDIAPARLWGGQKLQEMIISTQKASQASIPHIQRALEHGSYDISWGSKEEVDAIYKQKVEDGLV